MITAICQSQSISQLSMTTANVTAPAAWDASNYQPADSRE